MLQSAAKSSPRTKPSKKTRGLCRKIPTAQVGWSSSRFRRKRTSTNCSARSNTNSKSRPAGIKRGKSHVSYVLNTDADRKSMLEKIGATSVSSLFQTIPDAFQLKRPLNVPKALSEMELEQHVGALAAENLSADRAVCFLGGGSYDHYIPSVVDAVSSRSEYYTAYTPYQAEASQGSLQAFFEYQTLICELTGLDVSNASLYEGGSAVAESVLMSISIDPDRPKVLIAESVHPEYRQTLST